MSTSNEFIPAATPGFGGIDFTTPLNPEPVVIWSGPSHKGGAGVGPAGSDIAGEGSGATSYAGLGNYPAGSGAMGWGTKDFLWSSRSIERKFRDGVYHFSMKLLDGQGNETSGYVQAMAIVRNNPRPPDELRFVSYVAGTTTVTVSWTQSPDLIDTPL